MLVCLPDQVHLDIWPHRDCIVTRNDAISVVQNALMAKYSMVRGMEEEWRFDFEEKKCELCYVEAR